MNNTTCSCCVDVSQPEPKDEEPQPLVKLGDLSPLFFDQGIENTVEDAIEEEDPEPLVKLGDLSPLFFG